MSCGCNNSCDNSCGCGCGNNSCGCGNFEERLRIAFEEGFEAGKVAGIREGKRISCEKISRCIREECKECR